MLSFGESFNRTLICSVIVDKIDVISELIAVRLEYLCVDIDMQPLVSDYRLLSPKKI